MATSFCTDETPSWDDYVSRRRAAWARRRSRACRLHRDTRGVERGVRVVERPSRRPSRRGSCSHRRRRRGATTRARRPATSTTRAQWRLPLAHRSSRGAAPRGAPHASGSDGREAREVHPQDGTTRPLRAGSPESFAAAHPALIGSVCTLRAPGSDTCRRARAGARVLGSSQRNRGRTCC